ncbi:ATP-binding protein [Thaumasiovibrio subtropicus]|uniref:ATP-binding protein n=1 Tax=Thaumasiovibrio subtropicus TaxID=1891207 RepID=UPI000B354B10|nr:HAMP domain-containing sensor histidine kinase [Thaumasiovibrio subtropicus]
MKKANHSESLTRIVLKSGLIWYLSAILATGAGLLLIFEHFIEKRFDQSIRNQLYDLVAAAEITPNGNVTLAWRPSAPHFNQPLSGWYWQIISPNGEVIEQSLSLYSDEPLPLLRPDFIGQYHWQEINGPLQELRVGLQSIRFAGSDQPWQFLVAGPSADIDNDVAGFAKLVAGMLCVLGIFMLASLWFQVRQVLKPIHAMGDEIGRIRRGQQSRFEQTLPRELQSVGDELNTLLEHNSAILERSRLQAANLAHALKNPISVIQNELNHLDADSAKVMTEQLDKLNQNAQTHLSRARLSGAINQLASQTNVSESLSDILFSMELLYKQRGLSLGFRCPPDFYFGGDQHDLEEVLGNLIDNACKWADSHIYVNVEEGDHQVVLHIDDDGPGIPESARDTIFKAGKRLDETTEGSGLGMAIVTDIVTLYGGDISIEHSPLGGTRIRLALPGGRQGESSPL